MPSTRGMGSKMIWRCSASLLGASASSVMVPNFSSLRFSGHGKDRRVQPALSDTHARASTAGVAHSGIGSRRKRRRGRPRSAGRLPPKPLARRWTTAPLCSEPSNSGRRPLSVNSEARAARGRAMLEPVLAGLARAPRVERQSIEQMMASSREHSEQDIVCLPPDEERSIVHQALTDHYRKTLDEPIPALGNQTPAAADARPTSSLPLPKVRSVPCRLAEDRVAPAAEPFTAPSPSLLKRVLLSAVEPS